MMKKTMKMRIYTLAFLAVFLGMTSQTLAVTMFNVHVELIWDCDVMGPLVSPRYPGLLGLHQRSWSLTRLT